MNFNEMLVKEQESLVVKMLEASHKVETTESAFDRGIYKNLEILYRMCLQCDQTNIPKEGAIRTHKVVRLKKVVSEGVIRYLKSTTDVPYAYARVS